MAECAAFPLYINNLFSKTCCTSIKGQAFKSRNYSYRSCKALKASTRKMCKLSAPGVSDATLSPCPRNAFRCSCLGTWINFNGADASDWVTIVDQVLLMATAFLTYVSGVAPTEKLFFKPGLNVSEVFENAAFSGSTTEASVSKTFNCAWDMVRGKLSGSLNAIEIEGRLGNRLNEFDQHQMKQPLSLYAIAKGPRLRLLWASCQELENEVNGTSGSLDAVSMDNWLVVTSEIIQRTCQCACSGWIEKELSLTDTKNDKELLILMFEKLKGDVTILQNIQKSGKEDLYAELLCFLRFGSLRKGCCYDNNLFSLYGVAILEDLLITLADGIVSIYLQLISVDGNMTNEMTSNRLILCALSTRALQRLRNEVALNQWLCQNMGTVVSMYEDRFDLRTFQNQVIEEASNTQAIKFSLWKRLTLKKSQQVLPPLSYIVISPFCIPVKRIKELRALNGWRYYLSLFLELSDITMPLVRAVFQKFSDAISFFLVCLIGRSLGLIYSGIRQSLRWK